MDKINKMEEIRVEEKDKINKKNDKFCWKIDEIDQNQTKINENYELRSRFNYENQYLNLGNLTPFCKDIFTFIFILI